MISIGSLYSFEVDKEKKKVQKMHLGIDDMSFLDVTRDSDGFTSRKVTFPVTKKIGTLYINITDNLSSAMPSTHREYHKLALKLSDIYAWDIDFSSDIRSGDSVKVIVEELWVGEVFKGYGDILAVEFINNGKVYGAYRFENDGYVDYYDGKGKSLKKALLRSPLKFKYISSRFSKRRFHPKLRVYRPHLGVDYAAPTGTPVSSAGSGKVLFAGYKGQNGRMVRIKHRGGYTTYYGHLSKIPKKIRKGVKVSQGDIIGYVGSTGLATGPHLDYRIKFNGRFVNPLKIKLPRGTSVPKNLMANFRKVVDSFESRLASILQPILAFRDKGKISG
jgi:murein DD-endopeptidase MepM/ murein hydrolase activator NlpD